MALVRDEGRPAYIDRSGKVVIRPDADRAFPFSDGRAAFVKDKKYGFLDRTGKVVVPPVYSYARAVREGLAFVLDKGKSMFIDERGDVLWSKP